MNTKYEEQDLEIVSKEVIEKENSVLEEISETESSKTKNVAVDIEYINKIRKLRSLFEDQVGSSKEKDVIKYITNYALEKFLQSDEIKMMIQEALE